MFLLQSGNDSLSIWLEVERLPVLELGQLQRKRNDNTSSNGNGVSCARYKNADCRFGLHVATHRLPLRILAFS